MFQKASFAFNFVARCLDHTPQFQGSYKEKPGTQKQNSYYQKEQAFLSVHIQLERKPKKGKVNFKVTSDDFLK